MMGFIVDTEFVWGFQARIVGLSKTSPSFYYPPPTTFLGALAEVMAKAEGIGEKEGKKIIPKLGKNLLAIGVRPINCVPIKYEDLNRIVAVKITSGILYPNPKDLSKSFDSPARGKTILSSLDDNPPTIRWFLVFKNEKIEFNGNELSLSEEHFWKIHRLGSKESRVSVIDVLRIDKLNVKDGNVITNYSFPVTKSIKVVDSRGNWEYEVYVNPFEIERYDESENPVTNYISGKKTLPFKIPILQTLLTQPECRVELAGKAVAYEFEDEVVVGWSR